MTILDYIIGKIHEISVGIGIFALIIYLIIRIKSKKDVKLETLLFVMVIASALPTGIILLFCAFEPSLILKLKGMNIYIAVAGVALLYISIKPLINHFSESSKK